MAIKEYKCPNCGGAVAFDYGAQNIRCAHCGSAFEISAFEARRNEPGADAGVIEDISVVWEGADADGMETGVCPSCGAELFRCKNAVAMVCPHCDNAEISLKRLSGMLKPDYVIPFKIGKDKAVAALKRFCKDKYLLPDNYLEEKRVNFMQGVYAPFWLFDAKVRGRVLFKGMKINQYDVKNFINAIERVGILNFEKISVDGSKRLDDDYMDAIEPFYYKGMKVFDTAYLAGYLAEKYDVCSEESKKRAVKRIKGTFVEKLRETVSGYAAVKVDKVTVKMLEAKEYYALFPVWIFNTRYQGENYRFMVNGQTGRLAGKLPIDKKKANKFTAILTGAYGALFTLLAFVILRPETVKLFLGEDEFGDPLVQLLMMPVGYLIQIASDFKIFAIAALWGAAYALAFGIVRRWKKRMNTIALKTEAFDYAVRGSLEIL